MAIKDGQNSHIHAVHSPAKSDLPAIDFSDLRIRLREPVMGFISSSRICAHWLQRENPDFDEVRALVAGMIAASENILKVIMED